MGNFISNAWKDLTNPGWKSQEKAGKLADESAAGTRAMRDLASQFLWGNTDKGISATIPQSEQWTKNYLSFLQQAPTTTFNRQMGSLARNTQTAKDSLAKDMARRGLSTSGMASGGMAGIDMNRARGVSDLIAQMEAAKGQNLALGSQLTNELLNRALNMYSGTNTSLNSLAQTIPQASGGGLLQQLIGAYVGGQIGGMSGGGAAGGAVSRAAAPAVGGMNLQFAGGMPSGATSKYMRNALGY